jgi:hypothetical protein
MITIDGSKDPDKVPEWIIWRELLRGAVRLADESPTRGLEIWVDRLGLSATAADEIVVHGRRFHDQEKAMDDEAKSLVTIGQEPSTAIRDRLKGIQADKEQKIIAFRETLKNAIGEDAFNRLQSWSRLHIAPTIKVGVLMPPAK